MRALRTPAPQTHELIAADGIPLRLTRYRAGARGPLLVAHGLGVSSRIFTTDTIDTNLLEFLCANEFDVWLVDLRVSIDLDASKTPWTADDIALKDFPPAVAAVRALTGARAIDAFVHCYGATAFLMSMLAGLEGIRSIITSQIGVHAFVTPRLWLESFTAFPTLLRMSGLPALSARPGEKRGAIKRAYDGALGLLPTPAGEQCDSATCRRISFLYSRLYRHQNLTDATHDALPELFGASSLSAFEHLAAMVRHGRLVSARGTDDYWPHLKRLAIPTTFIHGEFNQCYRPEGTAATQDSLAKANGASLYERHVVRGYGHIDCIFGKNAATDVYPLVLRHFERVAS
jgi:cholesterol oxidase